MLKHKSEQNEKGKKGIAIILASITICVFGAMIGLAIDGGIAYFLKARLGQAMDAAALSGARTLARGVDVATQAANAQAVAQDYFTANFPNNFWGCTVTSPTVAVWEDTVNTHIRYVKVTGNVTTPLYFMRILGFTSASLSQTATAQRRDVNVMVVLDRSGSMAPGIAQMVTDASWFVKQFAEGRDEVGLVTFGGTYYMIKPSTSFAAVPTAIATLTSSTVYGTTDHAQPLWAAYQALAALNQPSSLNVIVFFTDGEPNTIFANWQPYLKNPTNCNNGPLPSGHSNPVLGYSLVYSDGATMGGLFANTTVLPPYAPGDTTAPGSVGTAYVNTAYDLNDSGVLTQMATAGCAFDSSVTSVASDFTQIPPFDYYGSATNPAVHAPTDCPTYPCTNQYKAITLTNFNATNLTAAAFNAGDGAVQRMRNGPINGVIPLIDTIALNDGSPIDSVYMNRLANTTSSSNYNSNVPTGLYVYTTNTSQLQPAFNAIASQILHLSQ
jgi:Flp pilus assembly protein TadG